MGRSWDSEGTRYMLCNGGEEEAVFASTSEAAVSESETERKECAGAGRARVPHGGFEFGFEMGLVRAQFNGLAFTAH
ncbi:hypothetical protein E2562_023412 [Oryza meyeriana var. granulata]|uniref:Uncharacterized protein n=1 Tax=Oryza meyeriana var. granulata TaxID=110450 RepID=A0A6G1FBA3_9ORYZ|nr:hypothetical protein E2562_023412 [Oryza meyeriana var. granulata]